MKYRLYLRLCAVAFSCAASAELTCRIEDTIRQESPFLHSPTRSALTVTDYFGTRGRPHGRYKKWRLNNFGFRGRDILLEKPQGKRRVVVLGASETFGLYESPHCEFPAQLGDLLGDDTEVVNTAIVGMTVASMINYWQHYVVRFTPDVVLIYPSTQFYLANDPPMRRSVAWQATLATPEDEHIRLTSRYLERLQDQFEKPTFVQKYLDARTVTQAIAGKPADWMFATVPMQRIELLERDLSELVHLIRQSGAQPILLTHAVRTAHPPSTSDIELLEAARVHFPRATAMVISDFEAVAARSVVELAAREDVPVIDIATRVGGHAEDFADLVHFTDVGATAVAREIAARLDRIAPSSRLVISNALQ